MHFSVEAHQQEVPALLNRLIGITGVDAWNKRELDFERQLRDNPLIGRYLDDRFPVERAMIYARKYRKKTGRYPFILSAVNADLGELYSFAAITARIHARLPRPAQTKLAQRFIAGLKGQIGLAPIVFEMRTVAHFLAMGFEVTFHDLCHGGGFDFLFCKSTIEVEVECKTVSGDLGHRVHVLRQYQLGPLIFNAMEQAHTPGLLQLAVATVADRLYPQYEFMQAVGRAISQALLDKRNVASDQCMVHYYNAPIAGSPFHTSAPNLITELAVTEHCSRIAQRQLEHLIITMSPPKHATVVAVRSTRPNQFLKFLYKDLKDASSQLSGRRPGFVCVQLRNTTTEQLRDIAEVPKRTGNPTGVQLMTSKFFNSDSRTHVHGVAYTARGSFAPRTSHILREMGGNVMRNTSISEDAGAYSFYNPHSFRANDPELNLV